MHLRTIAAGLALALIPTMAQGGTWKIDSAHSKASFSVRHMMVSNVSGVLGEVKGTIEGDAADQVPVKVEATVDTTALNTGVAARDTHVKSPDFMDTAKYPTLTFVSTKFEKGEGDTYKVTGNLTLHGVTKEVELSAEISPAVVDPSGITRRGAEITGKVNRQDFGVKWSKNLDGGGLVVGNDVKIEIEVECIKPGKGAKSAKGPKGGPAAKPAKSEDAKAPEAKGDDKPAAKGADKESDK